MSPSRSRWNIRGIQSRVGLLVVLGVLTSMLVPGWIAWKSLASLADQILLGRLSVAATAARHLDSVIAREWSKLQEVATGPGMASFSGDAAGQVQVLSALRAAYLRAEVMHAPTSPTSTAASAARSPQPASASARPARRSRSVAAPAAPASRRLVNGPNGPAVFLYVPIRDWSGSASGLVAGEIDPAGTRFGSAPASHDVASAGSIDVIDGAGVIVASSDAVPPGRRERPPAAAGQPHQARAARRAAPATAVTTGPAAGPPI